MNEEMSKAEEWLDSHSDSLNAGAPAFAELAALLRRELEATRQLTRPYPVKSGRTLVPELAEKDREITRLKAEIAELKANAEGRR